MRKEIAEEAQFLRVKSYVPKYVVSVAYRWIGKSKIVTKSYIWLLHT